MAPPERWDAVVIGAGPNGLTAAATLARAGRRVLVVEAAERIGGSCATRPLTLDGFAHDTCAAVHPLGVASPALRGLPLADHGLAWAHPELPLAHPLDDGTAAVLARSLDETADANGPDGAAWRALCEPLLRRGRALLTGVLAPLVPPRSLAALARFAPVGALPASLLARRFPTERGRALVAGLAAHGCTALTAPFTAGLGLVLGLAAHLDGWPVARGGSQSIADALASYTTAHGGEVRTGHTVGSLGELPPSRCVLADIGPRQLVTIAGDQLRHRRRWVRWRYGPGVHKVDYALAGPMPWAATDARRAGTVHLGGTMAEIAASEAAAVAGRAHARPYVLVAQPTLADPTRAPAGHHVLWAYCHVPHGTGPAHAEAHTAAIEAQFDRFAPGWRDLVLARSVRGPGALEAANPNLVGGDIAGGALDGAQVVRRLGLVPGRYRVGERLYLCSSSMPPGPGAHGMCGHHAALEALRTHLR